MARQQGANLGSGSNRPAAGGGARPGNTGRQKRETIEKVDYTSPEGSTNVDENGKLLAWPEDYKSSVHKPLKRDAFADESVWYHEKANQFEAKARKFRTEAEQITKLGGIKDRTTAKKLVKLHARLAEMAASLEAEGVDVSALLATMRPVEMNGSTETAEELAGAGA